MRKIRITSEGTNRSTRITDAETGENLAATELRIEPMRWDDMAPIRAHVTVLMPQMDIVLEADVVAACPYCQRPEGPVIDEHMRTMAKDVIELARALKEGVPEAQKEWPEAVSRLVDAVLEAE